MTVSCDTGDDEAVREMAAAVASGLGGADILVNAAARPNTGAVVGIDGFDAAEFAEQVNVRVLGYLRCIKAVVPLMRENGWGRIINVSGLAARSTGAITGTVRNVAVAALTKNLADELGRDGINVNVVRPGFTLTEKTQESAPARRDRLRVLPGPAPGLPVRGQVQPRHPGRRDHRRARRRTHPRPARPDCKPATGRRRTRREA